MKAIKQIFLYSLFIIFLLNFTSCFILKGLKNNRKNYSLDTTTLLKTITNNVVRFKTYNAKFIGQYSDAYNTQKFLGNLKIYNDSLILTNLRTSLGFSIGKLLIYKDSIKLKSLLIQNKNFSYEQINSTYGISLDFDVLQNIILDNFFTYPEKFSSNKYKIKLLNDTLVKLSYRKELPLNPKLSMFKDEIIFNLKFQKVVAHNIWDFRNRYTEFYLKYSDFTTINNNTVPQKINITVINTDTLKLKMFFRKIEIK